MTYLLENHTFVARMDRSKLSLPFSPSARESYLPVISSFLLRSAHNLSGMSRRHTETATIRETRFRRTTIRGTTRPYVSAFSLSASFSAAFSLLSLFCAGATTCSLLTSQNHDTRRYIKLIFIEISISRASRKDILILHSSLRLSWRGSLAAHSYVLSR